jgi:hypothetical protein
MLLLSWTLLHLVSGTTSLAAAESSPISVTEGAYKAAPEGEQQQVHCFRVESCISRVSPFITREVNERVECLLD